MSAQRTARIVSQSCVACRRILVAVVLVCALMGWATAASALGSDTKAFWGPLTFNGRSAFPIYHDLGVRIFEMSLDWRTTATRRPQHPLNPRDPAYRWPAAINVAIRQAAQYHMRILLQVNKTPGWANGHRAGKWAPRRPVDLANFLAAAAHRYPSVHLWMIWGEPSRRPNFAPLTPAPPGAQTLSPKQAAAPHRYAQMLDAAYGALKQVNSGNLVIGGDTYTTGDISTREWIENLRLPNGRPPRMDLYGHNPFSFRAPDLANPPSPDDEVDFSDLGRLSRLVNRNLASRGHHIRLFLSEWTIPTSPGDIQFNFWVDPSVAAQWIADAFKIARTHAFIYALGWVNLADDLPGQGTRGGLLEHNGQPKPGYYAFKAG